MEQALTWIGFTNDANRAALRIDIAEFEDMLELSEKDISDLEYSYSKRTVGDGRFIFGLQRTKRVKAMIHWVQDFARVSEEPTIEGLDEATFRSAITVAAQRATIRKQEAK